MDILRTPHNTAVLATVAAMQAYGIRHVVILANKAICTKNNGELVDTPAAHEFTQDWLRMLNVRSITIGEPPFTVINKYSYNDPFTPNT